MKSVCFVCHGSTHRSPFLRYALENFLESWNFIPAIADITVCSAGLYARNAPLAQSTLFYLTKRYGIDSESLSCYRSEALGRKNLNSDLILVVEPWMKELVINCINREHTIHSARCCTVMEYLSVIPSSMNYIHSLPDPVGRSIEDAEEIFTLLANVGQLVGLNILFEVLKDESRQ